MHMHVLVCLCAGGYAHMCVYMTGEVRGLCCIYSFIELRRGFLKPSFMEAGTHRQSNLVGQ